ncbi:protein retinal degeneration B-like isoform X2 [Lineus longissimus]|uniref:protein retinal degeneration B-like isoform X2 n=1 Tax=Lineus longissimus TaxID=88925 RepID=UPI00315CA179
MLIKEYRICLPMTVEEYRIAQLYMIQKKSREESSGSGSGVEILVNEPYKDGPGGDGQYTYKIYHIGSHLPGWLKTILPKSALRVEEEAWNAYPYTKTRYRCPFVEKFMLEIETRYCNDGGHQENIFSLSEADLRARTVDYMDIVKDSISSGDYRKEEDPKLFISDKTGRGPLTETWHTDYVEAQEQQIGNKHIMCAYKLCRVEFKYWGMQTKIERFIHDIGLRKTMLRAHRQAWCWQDEYHGLELSDIRELERQAQLALEEKMRRFREMEDGETDTNGTKPNGESAQKLPDRDEVFDNHNSSSSGRPGLEIHKKPMRRWGSFKKTPSKSKLVSPMVKPWITSSSPQKGEPGSSMSISDWRVESLEKLQDTSSDDEFFDAMDDLGPPDASSLKLYRASSMEMVSDEFADCSASPSASGRGSNFFASSFDQKLEFYKNNLQPGNQSLDMSLPATGSTSPSSQQSKTTVLFMVLHGGSMLDAGQDQSSKRADVSTFKTTLDSIVRAHYPSAVGHISVRLVPCPPVCAEALASLSSLSPYSFDAQSPNNLNVDQGAVVTNDYIPLGAIPLLTVSSQEYKDSVGKVIAKTNQVFNDFLHTDEGNTFAGQVILIADSIGSIFGYDCLCRSHAYSRNNSHNSSHGSIHDSDHDMDKESELSSSVFRKSNLETIKQLSFSNPDLTPTEENKTMLTQTGSFQHKRGRSETLDETHKSMPNSPYTRHLSLPGSKYNSYPLEHNSSCFEFDVTDFFMFGSPLAMVLALRRCLLGGDRFTLPQRPNCHQMYNLFHPTDPSAGRLEPFLNHKFKLVAPMKIARYSRYPLGDGESVHLVETIQSNSESLLMDGMVVDKPHLERRTSNMSIMSQVSGHGEINLAAIAAVTKRWWGAKRLDYALYCPEALNSFPTNALPCLLHASYWESSDVVSFILRQVIRHDSISIRGSDGSKDAPMFTPAQPREKWMKRRTTIKLRTVKLRNVGPNHRANDVIVLEDGPQVLVARFMYGPLDMVSLSGEKVDIHLMTQPPLGDWLYLGTEYTDGNGRVSFTIPEEKKFTQGMYPVKMVVRGDHTTVDFYLTVLPPQTESVVFSIDGSFTASVSIMGKDPKVRAGAVDVVRHWQELGYLIIYVTARPDMQHKKVVSWLAQHNFPHGMVSFMDGLSADPLRQKALYLKSLINDAKIVIHAAYGSSKDISVYQSLGVKAERIFIVGKASKKQHSLATVLDDGYAAHLSALLAHGGSKAAVGNARMVIRKGCFGLPGQLKRGKSSKKYAKRTTSLPPQASGSSAPEFKCHHDSLAVESPGIGISQAGNTVVDQGVPDHGVAMRARGSSPRPKVPAFRYESQV